MLFLLNHLHIIPKPSCLSVLGSHSGIYFVHIGLNYHEKILELECVLGPYQAVPLICSRICDTVFLSLGIATDSL